MKAVLKQINHKCIPCKIFNIIMIVNEGPEGNTKREQHRKDHKKKKNESERKKERKKERRKKGKNIQITIAQI